MVWSICNFRGRIVLYLPLIWVIVTSQSSKNKLYLVQTLLSVAHFIYDEEIIIMSTNMGRMHSDTYKMYVLNTEVKTTIIKHNFSELSSKNLKMVYQNNQLFFCVFFRFICFFSFVFFYMRLPHLIYHLQHSEVWIGSLVIRKVLKWLVILLMFRKKNLINIPAWHMLTTP